MLKRSCLALIGIASTALLSREPRSTSRLPRRVRADLQASIADRPAPRHAFTDSGSAVNWLAEMSQRLETRIPNFQSRIEFLRTVHFEAIAPARSAACRAVIQIESNFSQVRRIALRCRGYMQVCPSGLGWSAARATNLFSLRNNLRYGCVILKYYIDREKGDLFRAGSL